MSGIVAIFRRSSDGSIADRDCDREALVTAMLAQLRHRGPDGEGVVHRGPASLGSCLLATTPEDEGAVGPTLSRDGAVVVALDGRIDNRDEVVSATEARGWSDAKVVLAAYRRWGSKTASRLRGDFAFVVWDEGDRRLYAARDHFGVRPLFYRVASGNLCLASEMRAFSADPNFTIRPNMEALALFLADAYAEDTTTLYDGILALPSAHQLIATRDGLLVSRYWRADPWRRLGDARSDELADQLAHTLEAATKRRLRSNGSLAVALGGLDSSAVAATGERLRREGYGPAEPLHALHLGYPGMPCDESRYAHAVAARWGMPIVTVDPLDDIASSRPHPDNQPIDVYYSPQHSAWYPLLDAAASAGARTTLTGIAGDLLLRPTGVEGADSLRRGRVLEPLKQAGVFARPVSRAAWRRFANEAVRPLAPDSLRSLLRRLRSQPRLPHLTRRARAIVDEDAATAASRRTPAGAFPDLVARSMVEGIESRAVSILMSTMDRLAASRSAELRHPFLDVEVVELLLSVPHRLRHVVGLDKPKPILRMAMKDALPSLVLDRPDSAEFSCFVQRALLDVHRTTVNNLFENSQLVAADLIPTATAATMLSSPQSLRLVEVLNFVALEIWMRQLPRPGDGT